MNSVLWIPSRLSGLNELLAAAKSGRGKGNAYSRLKKEDTTLVEWHARAARLRKLTKGHRASFHFRWVEKNRKRDMDNVAAGGRKSILDGLVAAGVLPGDGWKHVAGWVDKFEVGEYPGVEVSIWEVPNAE